MGKVINVPEKVKFEVQTNQGPVAIEKDFFDFALNAINQHSGLKTLDDVCTGIEIRKAIKAAQDAGAKTITLEDAQFKILDGAQKAYLAELPDRTKMEWVTYFKAFVKDAVQDIDLSTKK